MTSGSFLILLLYGPGESADGQGLGAAHKNRCPFHLLMCKTVKGEGRVALLYFARTSDFSVYGGKGRGVATDFKEFIIHVTKRLLNTNMCITLCSFLIHILYRCNHFIHNIFILTSVVLYKYFVYHIESFNFFSG